MLESNTLCEFLQQYATIMALDLIVTIKNGLINAYSIQYVGMYIAISI
jgi:hypothetical protein